MSQSDAPSLRRVLGLGDLILYGIILIQPIAPVGIFGIASQLSGGHALPAILIAMVAMTLTAWSYGRMATLYPAAGSAYTYVSRGLNAHLGFLTGWAMFLDYLIIPVINTMYTALTLARIVPEIPYLAWAALTAIGITLLNLRGVRIAARANQVLLVVISVVVVAFVVAAVRFLAGGRGLFSSLPFYNPATFNLRTVAQATSLAALTYIGFDGVTTLAEEVRDPRRTVPLATVLVCLITGLLSAIEIYLAQRVWPDYLHYPNLETAFLDVCGRAGGVWLFQAMAAVLVVACFGSGLAGQAGAARLLYGMGRDRVLPRALFGYISAGSGVPARNVVLIGILSFAGAAFGTYERAAELLNFGAFLAFMGVNAAAFRARRGAGGAVAAVLGFVFCLSIWVSLPAPARIAGGIWFLVGATYLGVRTRGFRKPPGAVRFEEE